MGSTSQSRSLRVGVDVGGTNTDAVILDITQQHLEGRGVIAHFKTPTTVDVTDGIEIAVRNVLESSKTSRDDIASVTVGTTHFINAVVEQDARRLRRVAIIRLSKSFLREIPPFSEFPPGLTNIINGYYCHVSGGLAIDGSLEAPVVEEEVIRECQKIRELNLTAVVVAGVFSPIDEEFKQEDQVRRIVLQELPGVDVVCSHEVANIGFMERENAAILNASILRYARRTVGGFRSAMNRLNLKCGLFLTQNDGTLVDSAAATQLPIRTFSSGATNSMRGAAYLSGMKGCSTSTLVIDIGGTTSDVGVLLPSGFPRQANAYVKVAGVSVNYSMPHLESIGLGGGSIVRATSSDVTVGPDSVGHYLTSESLVFCGNTMTATDISVGARKANIGDPSRVENLDNKVMNAAQARIKILLERAIDVMKTSPEPLPVLLVGGGSIIAPETLEGASSLIRPPFHDVANAVGAAVGKVGGIVDIVQGTSSQTVTEATERAKKMATERAVASGAIESSVTIAEVDAMPLQYVTNQVRTIVKAVGDLDLGFNHASTVQGNEEEIFEPEEAKGAADKVFAEPLADPITYRPEVIISKESGHPEWFVSETDLEWLADGCYVLGCGGGGSPNAVRIQLRDQLRAGYKMRVINISALKEDAVIYWGGFMGAPAVSVERLASTEVVAATEALMEYLRHDSFDAVMALEIGGGNGLEPLLVGSSKFFDRPVLEYDFMARAYPTAWQITLCAYTKGELVPCALDSGDGNTIIMTRSANDEIVDRALRASCSEMGSRVGMALKPTTTEKVRRYAVRNSTSLAWRIGRCIARAHATNTVSRVAESIIEEVGGEKTAKILFRGKIVSVERRLFKGHSYGEITISGLPADEEENKGAMPAVATDGTLKIPFKNENIVAEHIVGETKETIAMVPDLIAVLDSGSGRAVGVPEYKYGLRVTVICITCSPRWTDTAKGLEIGGPGAFGFDVKYKPIGVYVEPKSVVLEYAPQ